MTKYIIELEDDIKYLIINGRADNRCYTLVRPVEELDILNSDYINENFGELQDEAYQKGFDDGKKSVSEPDRIEVGDEVQALRGKAIITAVKDDFVHYFYSDGDIGCIEPHYVTKTGKHYDIASILEAMQNDR